MSDTIRRDYDTSIGTEDRSAISATKFYGLILALVFLIGIVLLGVLYNSSTSEPAASGPDGRAGSSSQVPGP